MQQIINMEGWSLPTHPTKRKDTSANKDHQNTLRLTGFGNFSEHTQHQLSSVELSLDKISQQPAQAFSHLFKDIFETTGRRTPQKAEN